MNYKAVLAVVTCMAFADAINAIPEVSSKTEFKNLIESNNIVVDYYLPWCGPCRTMAPILDAVQADFADKVKFVKINFDAHGQLGDPATITCLKSGISAAPTFVFFKKGVEVDRKVGSMSKVDFIARVKNAFGL